MAPFYNQTHVGWLTVVPNASDVFGLVEIVAATTVRLDCGPLFGTMAPSYGTLVRHPALSTATVRVLTAARGRRDCSQLVVAATFDKVQLLEGALLVAVLSLGPQPRILPVSGQNIPWPDLATVGVRAWHLAAGVGPIVLLHRYGSDGPLVPVPGNESAPYTATTQWVPVKRAPGVAFAAALATDPSTALATVYVPILPPEPLTMTVVLYGSKAEGLRIAWVYDTVNPGPPHN